MDITRTTAGLALPIRCYNIPGLAVGSCTYDNFCMVLQSLTENIETTTPFFTMLTALFDLQPNEKIACPFNYNPQKFYLIKQFFLPDFANTIFSFISVGDFNVKLSASDSNGLIGCLNVKYTIKKNP